MTTQAKRSGARVIGRDPSGVAGVIVQRKVVEVHLGQPVPELAQPHEAVRLMAASKGSADPKAVRETLKRLIEEGM